MRNEMVAHEWAQQNQERGQSSTGNFSFEGRSLYSYNTEIARFIEGRVVATRYTYSVTTSGKHQNKIGEAVTHLENYWTSLEMSEIPDTWEDAAKVLFSEKVQSLAKDVKAIRRKRSSIRFHLECLKHEGEILDKLLEYQGNDAIQRYEDENPEQTLEVEILRNLSVFMFSRIGQFQDEQEYRTLINFLDRTLNTNLAEKMEQEREKERERIRLNNLANEEKRELWKQYKFNGHVPGSPLLRYSKNKHGVIETSLGAEVHSWIAKNLYDCLKSEIDIVGQKINHFTVNEVTEEHVKIGCHTIPREELTKFFEPKEPVQLELFS